MWRFENKNKKWDEISFPCGTKEPERKKENFLLEQDKKYKMLVRKKVKSIIAELNSELELSNYVNFSWIYFFFFVRLLYDYVLEEITKFFLK